MTPGGRTLSTGALLMLGAADLAFLNVWVFPRTSLAERLTRATSTPEPAPAMVATTAVAVERPLAAPERPPAEQPAPAEAPAPPVSSAEPAPPAEPAAAPIPPASGRTRVFFAHNQHALSPEAARALATLVRRRGSTGRILIEGHADRTGVEVYNGWLSQRRAEAVAGALAALGIGREQMEVRAFGSRRPAVDGGEVSALRRNRRVEISIIAEVTRER